MEFNQQNCEKCVKNFFSEVGIRPNRIMIYYDKLVYKLIEKKEFENQREKEEYILSVLTEHLAGFEINEPEKFRVFGNRKLDEVYRRLMSRGIILFAKGKIFIYETKFHYGQDSINKMDELLEILHNSWYLEKTFASLDGQNNKIADIVENEIKKILKERLISDIVTQAEIQIINKFSK